MANPYLTDFSAGLANGPPAAAGADDRARLLSSRSRRWDDEQLQAPGALQALGQMQVQAAEQQRYLGHWPELLADLALLGGVWVETVQAGTRLAQRRKLSGLRVHGMLGYLDTPEYQVRVLLDQCHALTSQDDEQGLVIEDANQQPLVSVQLEAGTHPLALRLLLSSLGAHGRRVVPARSPQDAPQIAALEQHPIHRLQRDFQVLEPGPEDPEWMAPGSRFAASECPEPRLSGLDFRDLAELSGRLSLNAMPWRQAVAGGGDMAIEVDPSLVPCALETLVDQVHPLALSSGSCGWISCSVQQFYGHAYLDGRLSLRGDEARLELDVRAIDSAWVVGRRVGEIDERSLRLYDEEGRAMAIIASAAPKCRANGRQDEARLWTTLMNALTS